MAGSRMGRMVLVCRSMCGVPTLPFLPMDLVDFIMPDNIRYACPDDDEKQSGERLSAKLLKTRTVLLSDEIDAQSAQRVITQLLLLQQDDPKAHVTLFIDSPGGDADAGFAIHDMIRFIQPPVRCVCSGLTASAAVIVLLGSPKQLRFSLPNARVLIHQPSTTVRGHAADIDIEASEILKIRDKINKLIAEETGQPVERIERDTKRNFWMSSEQAKDYGLVSAIVETRAELEKA